MISFTGDVPNSTERVVTGLYSLDRAVGDGGGNIGFPLRTLVELYGKKGIGKCLGKGTKVVLYSGRLVPVEEVKVGDLLMGADSTPRTVLSISTGKEQMYWIRQTYGIDYRVNESHILSLKFAPRTSSSHNNGDVWNVSIGELLSCPKTYTEVYWKGYKVGVEFYNNSNLLPIDPYFLGLWLGDGHSHASSITTADSEIVEYLNEYADYLGLQVTVSPSEDRCHTYSITNKGQGKGRYSYSLQGELNKLGVLNNKHIPHIYLYSPVEDRKRLLAGLIDSDGYRYGNVSYEITQKNGLLAHQIKYLCDSLGYRTGNLKKKYAVSQNGNGSDVYQLHFSGLLFDLPILVKRKQPQKLNTEYSINYDMTSIKIEKDTIDDYYGFTLDVDGLFLLEDFTVTHNTSFCLSMMGRIADKTGKPISILDFERQDPDTVSKILSLSGYEGDVHYITNQAKETPEDTLERFVDTMFTKQPPIGLVDSIGGFYPNAELEGKIGDSNMGVRAREVGQFSRRLVRSLQIADNPHSIFMTNHEHPTIGGMTQGTITPGGETKKYLSHLRLRIKPAFLGKSTIDFGSSWLIDGRVEHNRDGFSKTTFYVYMVAGEGIHTGLTAVWDCIVKGLATSSAANIKETSTISLDGKSYGKLKHIIENRKDDEMFVPFQNALKVESVESTDMETEEE